MEDDDDEDDNDEDMDDDIDMNDWQDDTDAKKVEIPQISLQEDAMHSKFAKSSSSMSTHRLITDYRALENSGKFGFTACPRNDNIYVWDVKLIDFGNESKLGKDLLDYAKKFTKEAQVHIEMVFQNDYPMSPPFIRVLRPKFRIFTGHVTIGGSICMQLLTRSGWLPSNDIESIIIQIRSEIMSDPDCRLDLSTDAAYSEADAKAAFDRMVEKYKWNLGK